MSTLGDRRAPAVICRQLGWKAGTCLEGDDCYGWSIIRITAIGENCILAREIRREGDRCCGRESTWALEFREWREVPDPDGQWQVDEDAV